MRFPFLTRVSVLQSLVPQSLSTAPSALGANTPFRSAPFSAQNLPVVSPILEHKSQSPYREAFRDVAPVPSLSSCLTPLPLIHYIPTMPLCLGHTPASGPLHRLFPLPGMFFPRWLRYHWGLYTNITSPGTPSLATWSIISATLLSLTQHSQDLPLPHFFPPSTWHYPAYFTHLSCLLSLPSTAAQRTQLGQKHTSLCGGYSVPGWLMLS